MRAISLGFACNNACLFCAQGDLGKSRPGRDRDLVLRAIEAVQPGDVVAFTGGEPTLDPDLFAYLAAAEARGAARAILQTNGRRLAYAAYARDLARACRVLALDVSLHGSTAAMHDWHTSAEGSFAQTVLGLRHARAEGVSAGVTTVVTRANYRHLAAIVRVAAATGARAIHFASVQPFGRAEARRSLLEPHAEMVAPHLERAVAEARRLGLGLAVGGLAVGGVAVGGVAEPLDPRFAGLGVVEPPVGARGRVEMEGPA